MFAPVPTTPLLLLLVVVWYTMKAQNNPCTTSIEDIWGDILLLLNIHGEWILWSWEIWVANEEERGMICAASSNSKSQWIASGLPPSSPTSEELKEIFIRRKEHQHHHNPHPGVLTHPVLITMYPKEEERTDSQRQDLNIRFQVYPSFDRVVGGEGGKKFKWKSIFLVTIR